MIEAAISKILSLRPVETLQINGHTYTTSAVHRVASPEEAFTRPLVFTTLTGLVDFYNSAEDGALADDLIKSYFHIENPRSVVLVGDPMGPSNERPTYAGSVYDENTYRFGDWTEIDMFIIALMTQFVETEDSKMLMSYLGNLSDEHVKERVDDGVSVTLTVKTGITTKSQVTITNPVNLAPYATFTEIDQPSRPFILRTRSHGDDVQVGLFAADGNKWQAEAIQRIKKFLNDKLPEACVLA